MLRRNTLRLLALSLGLCAALAIMEVGIRLWPGPLPPAVRIATGQHDLRLVSAKHAELGYALKPNVVDAPLPTQDFTLFHLTTWALDDSAVGFRVGELAEPPPAVLVGDSFAMGWGGEEWDSFAAHMERTSGLGFLNLGVVGYGPQQIAQVLETYGLPSHPRLVVWVLYANDFQDASTFSVWVAGGRPDWWLTSKSPFEIWFAQNCSTYKLYKALAPYRSPSRFHWEVEGVDYVFVRQPQSEVDLTRPEVRHGLDKLKRIWTELAATAEEQGFEVAVVALPHKELVYRDALKGWKGFDLAPRRAWTAATDEALEHARGLGFRTLDMLPFLEEHRGEQLYFPIDAHFTPLGNRLVGERLGEWLAAEGLVGDAASAKASYSLPRAAGGR